MMTFASVALVLLAAAVSIPVAILFVEVFAAAVARARSSSSEPHNERQGKVVVLVPAHNESGGILATLCDIQTQLRSGDRLLVVADNCTDNTAAVCRDAGAEVIERNQFGKRGKGYALDFGINHVRANPPECVIIIDADCRVSASTIDVLTSTCMRTGRPVQALDLMISPEGSAINYKASELAWRVKNWVRPLGLKALNLPCQLMGTGMAFPWPVLSSVNLATDNIVEDLKLGLELTAAGTPPLFCPSARVVSVFPPSHAGGAAQKVRWEHGHLRMIATAAPAYLSRAAKTGNLALLALTLDLAVPPLSLLALLLSVALLLALAGAAVGLGSLPLLIAGSATFLFVLAIFFAWKMYGTDLFGWRDLNQLIGYAFSKTSFYWGVLRRRRLTRWERAERDKHQ